MYRLSLDLCVGEAAVPTKKKTKTYQRAFVQKLGKLRPFLSWACGHLASRNFVNPCLASKQIKVQIYD